MLLRRVEKEYRATLLSEKENSAARKNKKSLKETELLKAQLLNKHLLAQKQEVNTTVYPITNQYDTLFNSINGFNQTNHPAYPSNFDYSLASVNKFFSIKCKIHFFKLK